MPTAMDKAQVTQPSEREVKVTRSFRAPRALVYRAYTEPDLVRRWLLGPPGWSMPVCEMDVRVGGQYRWRRRSDENGSDSRLPQRCYQLRSGRPHGLVKAHVPSHGRSIRTGSWA